MTLEIKEVEDLAKLSLVIWSNSKLAQREFKAHDTVTEFFDNYTFPQVDSNFILPTGFRAVATKPRNPHVALLVEHDALSDIRHPSGQNLIVDAVMAFAIAT